MKFSNHVDLKPFKSMHDPRSPYGVFSKGISPKPPKNIAGSICPLKNDIPAGLHASSILKSGWFTFLLLPWRHVAYFGPNYLPIQFCVCVAMPSNSLPIRSVRLSLLQITALLALGAPPLLFLGCGGGMWLVGNIQIMRM